MGVLPRSALAFCDRHVAYAKDEALEPVESLCTFQDGMSGIHAEGASVEGATPPLWASQDESLDVHCKTASDGEKLAAQDWVVFPNADMLQNTSALASPALAAEEGRPGETRGFARSEKQRICSMLSYRRPELQAEGLRKNKNASLFLDGLKRTGKRLFSLSRWHLLVLLCCYSVLIGPVYLNWAPFRQLLFDNGVYFWTCAQQRLHVGNLFTLCTVADYGMSFFGGLAMDVGGPKLASVGGSLLMTLGWLLLAFSSETFRAFELGMVLFGLGIDMAFYGTLPVGSLFPGHCNTVRALLVAMRSVSYMTPVVLQNVATSLHISYRGIMVGYAVAALAPALLIAAFVTPWRPWEGGGEGGKDGEDGGEEGENVGREAAHHVSPSALQVCRRAKRQSRRLCCPCFPWKTAKQHERETTYVDGEGSAPARPPSILNKCSKNAWESQGEKGESEQTSASTPVVTDQTEASLKHPSVCDSWPAIPTDTGSLSMISLSSSPKHLNEDGRVASSAPCPSEPSSRWGNLPERQASLFSGEAERRAANAPAEEAPGQHPERERGPSLSAAGVGSRSEGVSEEAIAAYLGQQGAPGRREKAQHVYTRAMAFAKNYLVSSLYLPIVPYFTITLIRAVYFNTASHDLVPHALTFLHIIIGFVFIFPPIAGYIADRYGILLCMTLVNSCGTLVILLSLVTLLLPGQAVWLEYVIAVLFMQNMSLMTNQIYFYVGATFPQRHLGKLIGFTCTVGGLLSLLAAPMFDYSVKSGEHGFLGMLTLLAALSGVTYLLLLVLHVMKRRALKRKTETAVPCTAVVTL
ncbi:conserved hypothetical protein [Neospora caninum Liverpool]|uniref:Uncharacterized protein n=1 Tax=Neospora caninum (strain Liverpool) TaxID=572307 RepID=F0VET7_NEOCL|nr:conserved hypothetical protein [Neospora caninum Liverpool]CBZ52231.1 conserved hypothetical protein [Neospora caninum Liverpool]|eukprot:XP_003882263.1 conserved hypothetical protein [Neospora caninum Liverpool]